MNSETVKTLNEFRMALKKSVKTDFLSIETHDNRFAVFEFRSMLKDERALAASFSYPISESINQFIGLVEDE